MLFCFFSGTCCLQTPGMQGMGKIVSALSRHISAGKVEFRLCLFVSIPTQAC